MPKNLPYIQFYVRDWISDPKLALCSPLTRGLWFEALCAMHLSDTVSLSGTPEQLSRILRCTMAEVQSAVSDLEATGAADMSERNGVVTLTSRRRKRDKQTRLMANRRVKKHRCNARSNAHETPDAVSASVSDSGSSGGGGAGGGADGLGGDDLDSQIRRYVGEHPRLPFDDMKTHANIRALVTKFGWEETKTWIDNSPADTKFPAGWAMSACSNHFAGKGVSQKQRSEIAARIAGKNK